MNRRFSLRPIGYLILLLAPGCASAPSDTGDAVEMDWAPGVYLVRSTVGYRSDSAGGSTTGRKEVTGEVTVAPDGPVSMTSSEGLCRDPDPTATQRDRDRGRRRFLCGRATFELRPGSESLQGTVELPVVETIRTRGSCEQYVTTEAGGRTCARYENRVKSEETVKTVRIRSRKIR